MSDHFKVNGVRTLGVWLSSGENVRTYSISIVRTMSHDVIYTDQGPAFRNELFSELSRLSQVEHSFATAYSKEENGLVERANQEVMRHLHACTTSDLTNSYLWCKKTSTGVTPVELILNNSIRLSNRILSPPDSVNRLSQVALSDATDNGLHDNILVEYSLIVTYLSSTTHVLQSTLFTLTCYSHHLLVAVINSYPNIVDHSK